MGRRQTQGKILGREKIREEISQRLEGSEGMAERYNSLHQGLLLR